MLTRIKCGDCYMADKPKVYNDHVVVRCPFIDRWRQVGWTCKFRARVASGADLNSTRKTNKACFEAYNRWVHEQEELAAEREKNGN